MNFLSGMGSEDGLKTADGLILPVDANATGHGGSQAGYGIRPEHLALDDAGLPFAVEIVEPTGSETQVQGKLGDQPLQGVFRERIDPKPGQTIRVSPQPGAIHLFDAQSTRRIN